ncbi:MAG TPA: pantetheine-phosphate adenylyltransferase [Longimicrobium sp.]|nr:pantetheine-phosphate adenylyltransferase [Longimicrobium sp.]
MSTGARIAVCPGSFDPITLGHEDIVRRALAFADRVVVAVAHSPQSPKAGMFTVGERVALIREAFAGEARVEAEAFQGLLVDYARSRGATLVIRGVRTVADFEYEMQMALMNRKLHGALETVFLAPDPEHSFVSGTLVRQIHTLGGDVSPFVSAPVLRRLREKVGGTPAAAAPPSAGEIAAELRTVVDRVARGRNDAAPGSPEYETRFAEALALLSSLAKERRPATPAAAGGAGDDNDLVTSGEG